MADPRVQHACVRCGKVRSIVIYDMHRPQFTGLCHACNTRTSVAKGPNRAEHRADGTTAIHLTQEKVCIIDTGTYDLVKEYRWCAVRYGNGFYALTKTGIGKGKRPLHMHRLLCATPAGFDTDHIDRNGLNNRMSNLRVVTHADNLFNSARTDNTSGYAGVCWDKNRRLWSARLSLNGKEINLGRFASKDDAIEARRNAEDKYRPGIRV